jgi:putative membrane-bound dehydrogenase-like protein
MTIPNSSILLATTAALVTGNAVFAQTADERYGLEVAKKNMATFKTADGLKVALVAAEPMIQNPTNIEVDPKGRIWAVECVNYRRNMKLRPEGDRVVILEDTDGDGLVDKEKTFYQNVAMTNPLGICVLPQAKGTKVIVSAAPNVWLLTDSDGDDVAEDAKVIFKIGGGFNHDHQVHAFVFGPEGKFYFNGGDATAEVLSPDGTPVKDLVGNEVANKGKPYRRGMVFRCDIDLETGKASNFETVGHNFRNNFEVCVDSFGTMWQSDNDDDGNRSTRINYVMEHGNFGYTDEMTGAGWGTPRTNIEKETHRRHWYQNDPGVVPNLLPTGQGSPTGILIHEGNALGAQFTNQLIHCEPGPRTVRSYPVENDGAGYKATMVDILTSTDSWYRASDVAIAPDGSLVISDWYDPGVGGHAMGDRQPGKIMGRVYRVSTTGNSTKATAPDVSTAAGAVKALQSPNKPTQFIAWRALHGMGATAETALLGLWKHENPRMRARALSLLAQIKGSEAKHLAAGIAEADPNLRIAAIRLSQMLTRTRGFDAKVHAGHLAKLVADPNPQVRRQVALALFGSQDVAKLWTALAQQHDGTDRWYLEALGIGAMGHEDACFNAWLTAVGTKWNTPAGRDIIWRMRSAKNADYLARIITDAATTDADKPRYFRAFDFLPASPAKTTALASLAASGAGDFAVRESLLRLKGLDLAANPDAAKAINTALERAKGTPAFIDLVRDFRVPNQGPALLATAIAIAQQPAASEAVKMVLKEAHAEQVINDALTTPKAADLVDLLGNSGTPAGIARVEAIVAAGNLKPEIREQAVRALARSQSGAEKLIALARDKKLPATLAPTAGRALRSVEYVTLKKDIDELFPVAAAPGGKALPTTADLVKLQGDIAKGRAVFERAESSCVLCHRIGDKGADFGPGLGDIGAKLPKEQIYENIINPSAGLSMGFETTVLTLKDGTTAQGIVRSDTRQEVVLALPGGATNRFEKGQIAKREKLTTSMMPTGLNQLLSQDDLVNLVEYLASLKPQK